MKAVVLAGGYGVRLRPLTYTRPKPMLPLAGKPVLHHIIDFLADNGFDEIIVTSNYLRKQIEAYFGSGNNLGVKLSYPVEPEPLGTAGCVKNIEESLREETFVVIQGDNITNIDLNKALESHQESEGLATILLVKVDDASEFGIAKLNGRSNITKFVEKPRTKEKFNNLANAGLYILEPQVLSYIPTKRSFDFSKELFPRLMEAGERLMGYKARGKWFDIGRVEDYLSANRWMLNRLEKREGETSIVDSEAVVRGPVFVGKDVEIDPGVKIYGPTIIGDNCHIKHDATIVSPTAIGPNVETGKEAKIMGSIIYENTEIGHESRLAQCIVGEDCEIGSRTTLWQGSVIGAACQIGNGTTITAHAKIWPQKIVKANSIIQGLMK